MNQEELLDYDFRKGFPKPHIIKRNGCWVLAPLPAPFHWGSRMWVDAWHFVCRLNRN